VMDELGWLYFKDRAGDTFRWKGENVSTMEVEATISQVIGLRDCVVYGVEIPGAEGRAGMAAIPDPERKVDVAKMYVGMSEKLPAYARPIFLRFVDEIDLTGKDQVFILNDMIPTFFLHSHILVEEERFAKRRIQPGDSARQALHDGRQDQDILATVTRDVQQHC
jgi:hypothetical protein